MSQCDWSSDVCSSDLSWSGHSQGSGDELSCSRTQSGKRGRAVMQQDTVREAGTDCHAAGHSQGSGDGLSWSRTVREAGTGCHGAGHSQGSGDGLSCSRTQSGKRRRAVMQQDTVREAGAGCRRGQRQLILPVGPGRKAAGKISVSLRLRRRRLRRVSAKVRSLNRSLSAKSDKNRASY